MAGSEVVSASGFVIEVMHAGHQMMSPSTMWNSTSIVSNGSGSLDVVLVMFMCGVGKWTQAAACIVLP